MIDIEKINERKEVLAADIATIRERLGEQEQKKLEDVALLNALIGAFQQCDAFITELDNDNPEGDSDVENSEEADEAVGGTD
jgi:hypothetical protein|tara:strand:+ start:268 stop:513 length:246 start_codon:yes stop_codon:yes gene_type:complete